MTDTTPFFIVSAPRSGSTLLRLMLDAHPRLAVPPPAWLFDLVYPYMYSYGDLDRATNLTALAEDVLATPTVSKWPHKPSAGQLVERVRSRTFEGMFAALCEFYAQAGGKVRWGEKTPRNAYWIDALVALFPGAKIIHILRDGRDMAVDIAESVLVPHTVYGGAALWRDHVETIRASAARLPPETFHEIRYEALCADPAAELRRLCGFLGEAFDDAMLAHHHTDSARAWSGTATLHARTARPVTTEFCGIHRDRITPADRRAIEALIGDTLEACGYAVEGTAEPVDPVLAARFRSSDSVTNIDNVGYRNWHVRRRIERREQGVWSDAERESRLWSPD